MRIDFDPAKRHWTIETRGLDFADAITLFEGDVIDILDDRVDYGELRYITVGQLGGPDDRRRVDTARRHATSHIDEGRRMSASKRGIGSDLAYVDAYVLTEADYMEIPELTDEDFVRGVVVRGGSVAVVTDSALVRLDADTVATYRALGKNGRPS